MNYSVDIQNCCIFVQRLRRRGPIMHHALIQIGFLIFDGYCHTEVYEEELKIEDHYKNKDDLKNKKLKRPQK